MNYLITPSSITHLKFNNSHKFNQSLDNIPSSITHLFLVDAFVPSSDLKFINPNLSLNNLPKFIEFIQLPKKYEHQILNLPPKLKTIKCYYKYKYIQELENFVGLEVIKY